MKRVSFVFLIFLWGYNLACSGDAGSVIKVGIHPYGPFVSVESGNQAKGIFSEMIEYVATQEGWKIEYVPGSLGQCLSRLENNEIDLVCALAFSEVMDRYYDFNGENLVTDWTQGSESTSSDISPSPVYYAVLQGTNKGLISAIDGHIKILKSTPDSVYYQSMEKWAVPVSQAHPFPIWLRWSLVSGLAVVLLLFFGNLVLRNRVKAKTRTLTLTQELARRKQTEEALMESDERFRMLFNEVPDAILIISMDDIIMDANVAASRMLGYTCEEFKTMSLTDLQAPSVRGKKGGVILNELILGRVFEGLDIHKDGTLVPIEVHNHKTRFKGQEIVLSVVRNIAERKKAEEELRASDERYREFFEQNISGSYISNPEGQLIACNREYRRIFQFATTQEALGTPMYSLFEDPKERNYFLIRLKKEKRIIGYEPRLKKVGGVPLHVTVNASGVFDLQGNLKHIRGFVLDVSEQRRLEAQLRQAQKMETIGTLAGGIAHDFNNILFPILGHTEMLLHDTPETSPAHDRLKKIYAGGIRARDLVRQILTFSRQDTNEKKLVNMQPIINEALELIRFSIPATIDIQLDIPRDCGFLMANPTQIHQIVLNLTTNAYQAMEETGGTIGVSLNEVVVNNHEMIGLEIKPGRYACLTVSDTGRGIEEEISQKIFEPFFTTKEKGKGTGMGLSVVHGIVQSMGGAIQILSKPGKGVTFRVYLPLALNFPEGQEIGKQDPKIPEIEDGK